MKSILLITAGFPYGTSEQSFIQTEFDCLRKAYDVHVLAEQVAEDTLQKGYEDVRARRYRSENPLSCFLKVFFRKSTAREIFAFLKRKNPLSQKLYGVYQILKYAARAEFLKPVIAGMIREYGVDLVYTYWCVPATLAAVRCRREFPGMKIITRFHGYDLYEERNSYNWQPFKEELIRELDGLFFACTGAERYFRSRWGREGFIDFLGTPKQAELPEGEEGFVLVSCSVLIPLKRVDLLIRALAALPESCRVRWVHFGDGSEREALETLAARLLGEKENIRYEFRGDVENGELLRTYGELRPALFITVSSTEGGAPVSIQEALSLGIPAVGTRVGGIPDTIQDGENGRLLPADPTEQETAEVIRAFCEMSREEREPFRKAARWVWAEKFDAERNARVFTQQVKEILGEG